MRALVVQPSRAVTETDLDLDELFDTIVVATAELDDEHEILYDDEALANPGLCYGRIGRHSRIPLPAYVVGVSGEHHVDATLPVDDLEDLVD